MSPLDRELRDAFKALSDASLKISELLSFEDPSRPEVWPNTGEPLTAKRFHRMMNKDEAPDEPAHLNYDTGHPLASQAQVDKRIAATKHASVMGYDYEHWCRMVYRVRTEVFRMDRKSFAKLQGLTDAAVRHWESGISFASLDSRTFLERVSAALHGVEIDSWRGSK